MSEDFFLKGRDWLTEEESRKADRFLREQDRRRFVLGRSMIRAVCARYVGVAPKQVLLGQSVSGKPLLVASNGSRKNPVEFNVSHGGEFVIIAWSSSGLVGVDVEPMNHLMPEMEEMARASFSESEREVFLVTPLDQRLAVFLRIWVRKEAVLKAEGCGVGGPLQSFSVVRLNGALVEWTEAVLYPESGRFWQVVDLDGLPGHVAALAMPVGCDVRHCAAEEAGFL